MRETFCALISSPFMGAGMPKAYSRDLRERVITACGDWCVATRGSRAFRGQRGVGGKVAAAGISRGAPPEAARRERFAAGRVRGRDFDLTAQRPDLTLVETVAELRKRRIKTSRSSLWRFLDRQHHAQKSAASSRTAASRCGASAPPLDTRARYA